MTHKSSRFIPGTTLFGVTRGGGVETIEWVSSGPMVLNRSVSRYLAGLPLTSYYSGGAVRCQVPVLPNFPSKTDNEVRGLGDTAINASRPSSASVNLLTSAGELASDGLPTLPDIIRWRRSTAGILAKWSKIPSKAAKDYVAYQFAWRPLEREIKAYCRQVVEADNIVKDARKAASQRKVKVAYSFPKTAQNTSSHGTLNCYGWVSGASLGNLALGSTSYEAMDRVWFEGEYLYFFPIPKDNANASTDFAFKAKHVLGIRLTPEVLWELAPWSWCADWLTNTDVVIQSISSTISDGMILTDAFVMHHHYNKATRLASGAHMSGDGKIARFTPTGIITLVETKTRFPSVPYLGFGGTAELTAKQISILAALGISRA